VTEARKSLDEKWTAFQTATDEYLETTKADLTSRQALLEAALEARRKAWQKSIEELRTKADKLAGEQRAAIKARIDALSAQADEAKARIGRLQDASGKAWNTAKKSSADAQQLFFDTYTSIRKSMEDASK
jgi:chromosome segregation ATPase